MVSVNVDKGTSLGDYDDDDDDDCYGLYSCQILR